MLKTTVVFFLTKEGTVPDKEIKLAIVRKAQFARDPQKHTYKE